MPPLQPREQQEQPKHVVPLQLAAVQLDPPEELDPALFWTLQAVTGEVSAGHAVTG
jgi:hypothetical protein